MMHTTHQKGFTLPGYFPQEDLKFKTSPVAPAPSKRTTDPIVTGTSVIAVKYNGGVVMAADTLASYGSLARFFNIDRMKKVGDWTAIGAGGEYSDFQQLSKSLDELVLDDFCRDDGRKLHPEEIYSWLCRVMYNRRTKGDPYWNSLIVAGHRNDKSFLGYVDLVGTCYQDDYVTTGYGSHLALPIIRKAWNPHLTLEEATKLVTDCMRVLFYRDARSSNKIQITTLNNNGVTIADPIELTTYHWDSGESAIHDTDF